MLTYTDIDPEKKGFIFELDDVLFPEKDYLLQVYYLFGHFLEYVETTPMAKDLIDFCKTRYEHHGQTGLFDSAAEVFGIDPKYRDNFNRLHAQAKLPLKLLLYKDVLELVQAMAKDGKPVAVLTLGDPMQQLNKVKQMEWNGLDKAMRIFFYEELLTQPDLHPIHYVARDFGLKRQELLFFGVGDSHRQLAQDAGVDYVDIRLFLNSDL